MKLKKTLFVSLGFKLCLVSLCIFLFCAHYMVGEDVPVWFDKTATNESVKRQIFSDKQRIDMFNEGGVTGLMVAAAGMNLEIVKAFVEVGADINLAGRDEDGDTPLHLACYNGGNIQSSAENTLALVRFLLNNGANVNARNNLGQTPLHRAMQIPNIDLRLQVMDLLVSAGADINAQHDQGFTVLHMAVNTWEREGTRKFIEKFGGKINFDLKNKSIPNVGGSETEPMTAQEYAISLGYNDIANIIIEYREKLGR